MRISMYGGSDARTVTEVVQRVQAAERAGFPAIWFPQEFHIDTLSALGVAAHRSANIELGTAVVPIQGRHPIALAQQALTISEVAGPGRFTLGIGASHKRTSERAFGVAYAGMARRCQEYIAALRPLLSEDRRADVSGEHLTARAVLDIAAPTPGLVVGALGPRMLELAGRTTDGVVTWMAGPDALQRAIVPAVRSAAEAAGRQEPRVIVGLPVGVTDHPDQLKQSLGPLMQRSARQPSYARMVALQGLAHPVELALIGGEDEVADRVAGLADAGATEFVAIVFGRPEEVGRTTEFLRVLGA